MRVIKLIGWIALCAVTVGSSSRCSPPPPTDTCFQITFTEMGVEFVGYTFLRPGERETLTDLGWTLALTYTEMCEPETTLL